MTALKAPCQHGRYEEHRTPGDPPGDPGIRCPGGRLLPADTLQWCIAHESVQARVLPTTCHFLLGGPMDDAGDCVFIPAQLVRLDALAASQPEQS
jgi:hypothetical protein